MSATPEATAAPMSHQDFVRALNRSCSKDKNRQDALSAKFDAALEAGELPKAGAVYSRMLVLLDAHRDRAAALDPPGRDRAAFKRYLSAQARIIGLGERIAREMKANDTAGVAGLTSTFQREQNRRLLAAVDIGADRCGSR